MEEVKKCPYCSEEILATAKKCKHCGEWLNNNVSAAVNTGLGKTVTWWDKNIRLKDEETINGTPKISEFCKRWYIINSLFIMLFVLIALETLSKMGLYTSGYQGKLQNLVVITVKFLFVAIPATLALFTIIHSIRASTKARLFALIFSFYSFLFGSIVSLWGTIPLLIFSLISIITNKSKKR